MELYYHHRVENYNKFKYKLIVFRKEVAAEQVVSTAPEHS